MCRQLATGESKTGFNTHRTLPQLLMCNWNACCETQNTTPTDLTPGHCTDVSLCCYNSAALCWTPAVLSATFLSPPPFVFLALSVAPGSSPTWMTRSWMTPCPENMCYICDPAGRCSSSSRTSGSSPVSPVARIRPTTSSPTSRSASSSWSVSIFM